MKWFRIRKILKEVFIMQIKALSRRYEQILVEVEEHISLIILKKMCWRSLVEILITFFLKAPGMKKTFWEDKM